MSAPSATIASKIYKSLDRGDRLEPGEDVSRIVKPPHMGVTGGEEAIG